MCHCGLADCTFVFKFAQADCKLWPSDGDFKSVESFMCDDWQIQHKNIQKMLSEQVLEDPDAYQSYTRAKLMRWIGRVGSCSKVVQTGIISSKHFSTVAAPGCIVPLSNGGSASYQISVHSFQRDSDATLHVGWATFALKQSDSDAGGRGNGVGDSMGSWKVALEEQVLCLPR